MRLTQKGLSRVSAFLVVGLLVSGSSDTAQAKAKEKPAKVDLNTASQQELENLPGVGEATAKKIVAGRPYSKVADLEKAGVPKGTVDKIRKLVTVSKSSAKAESSPAAAPSSAKTSEKATQAAEKPEKKPSKDKAPPGVPATSTLVNLNASSQKELEELPGVGAATAKKIIAGRPYSSVEDLAKAGVSKSTIGKIRSLVVAGPSTAASKPTPAASASSSSASAPAASASSSARTSEDKPAAKSASAPAASANKPAQPPPAKGMVWVNTATKVYHYEGDHWYGNTKEGKYMTEDDAIKAGYRASKEGQKKQ